MPLQNRVLSADGEQVFFESTDKLVASDTNGDSGCPEVGSDMQNFHACQDVYEWEAQGSGGCERRAAACAVISTGKSSSPSFLIDASADGNDVFFLTRSQLVRQDEDELVDAYDARVDGGLPRQNEPHPPVCESLDGCRQGADPSARERAAGSASFSGPADPKPGKLRKHRAKKKRKQAKHRKANHKRGARR